MYLRPWLDEGLDPTKATIQFLAKEFNTTPKRIIADLERNGLPT